MKPEEESTVIVAPRSDRGSILLIVLVLSVVMALVVVGLATYAAGTLRFGQVVEASADRLASANGAMDNALEDLARGTSPCALFSLGGNAGGLTYPLGDTINGITPTINCESVAGDVNAVDAFAVIITGAGTGRTGELLTITNGGNSANAQKVFEGPVYLGSTPRGLAPNQTLDFRATLTIKNGDLWYSNSTCPATDVALPAGLTISPAGYTTKCRTEDWSTLFSNRKPPEPAVTNVTDFPVRSSTSPAPDSLGCHVWPAGRYNSPPNLANNSYNYFQSGDYYFANTGTWSIQNAFVLMGWPGSTGPSIDGPKPQDTFANNVCRDAWGESNHAGSTIYLGGNSSVEVRGGSTLEVSGKDHGGYNVGIQALETAGVASTIRGNTDIVLTESGGNKQLSVQGLVWAPYAAFEFDLISNDAVAALTGGAVVGELSAGASANANNFVIRVDTQPTVTQFAITATAVNSGTTKVRTLLDYRTDRKYAILSRRVQNLTVE
jgi:hypothetical protein